MFTYHFINNAGGKVYWNYPNSSEAFNKFKKAKTVNGKKSDKASYLSVCT